jgi:pyridoxal biosynthesis lyase PdxS
MIRTKGEAGTGNVVEAVRHQRTRSTGAPRSLAAATHFQDPDALAKVSRGLGEPMPGLDIKELGEEGLLQTRGW